MTLFSYSLIQPKYSEYYRWLRNRYSIAREDNYITYSSKILMEGNGPRLYKRTSWLSHMTCCIKRIMRPITLGSP